MTRETRYLTEKEIEQARRMAGLGMPVDQMAHVLEMGPASLERRMRDQPGVNDAILKGRAQASMQVRQTAFQMAVSGKQPALTIFWLKTREGWKEPKEEDLASPYRAMSMTDLVLLVKEKIPELEKAE